jgi:hypothetical protein
MRGAVSLALAVAALCACASGSAGTSQAATSLTISYWAEGPSTSPRVRWTLRCNPARGTLARPRVACRKLAAGGRRLFDGVPKNVACTQIYGGPQVARVVGVVRGVRVQAVLNRTDGCQIARWDRLSSWLLPAGGS